MAAVSDGARPEGGRPGGGDRDRNAYGRAQNQRPRDRTGRPLAYDTDETALAEDHDYDTVEEALATGRRLWDAGRYFEAHECLEDVWHHSADGDEDFWQGVIQVAVGCVHHQRDNDDGALATFHKAGARLRGYPDHHHGIDTAALREYCEEAAQRLKVGEPLDQPSLPVVDGGPVFDPAGAPTTLTRQPPWMAAVEQDGSTDA